MNDPTLAPVAPQIQINAANGIVTLSGTVKSEQEKTRIADVIRQTSGVVSVNNQLSVSLQPTSSSNQSSTTTSSPDQTSTTSPTTSEKSALSQSSTNQLDTEKQGLTPTSDSDRRNESERIYHSTPANQSPTSERSESRIYSTKPSDTTSSAQQSQQSTTDQGGRAGTQPSITGSEQGKSSFEANIQSTTATDRTLGQQIMQQLKTDTSLAAALPTIKLSINNGKVTLSGAAQSEQQKQQIESTVKRVSGVSSVENQIQVSAKSSTDTGSKSTTDTNP
jgi:osmotically-inducible protein OsmY